VTRRVLQALAIAALCALSALFGASVARSAASRPAAVIPADAFVPVRVEPDQPRTGAPTSAAPPATAHPVATPTAVALVGRPPRPTVSPVARSTPAPTVTDSFRLSIRGTASWGYGWSGVVTRLPRGTAICVTGPLGRWCGRSVGYGPAVYTHRIADLSRAVFASICGPLSQGLCRVTLAGA
jgi:hypothetical protein